MTEPRLIIYVDNDYLIPIVDNYNGNLEQFQNTEDGRIWVYFYDSPHKSGMDFSRECKASFQCGKHGYIGDFWKNVAEEKHYANDLAQLPYCCLLENSGILEILRGLYSQDGLRSAMSIPTVYIFSPNIPPKAQKVFLKYMEEKSFQTISYALPLESLCMDYLRHCIPSAVPQFGEKSIILQSTGTDLLMSCYAYDGQQFLPTDKGETLKNQGNNPVKRALVTYVVNKMEQVHNFLSPEALNRELDYQMQYADQWLASRKDPVFDILFHYSTDPKMTYTCKIDNTYLTTIQENSINELMRSIIYYRNSKAKNDLFKCILIGDAFSDELFYKRLSVELGNAHKIFHIPPHIIPEVLHLYMNKYASLLNKLKEFDSIIANRKQKMESIRIWIKSAEQVRALQVDIQKVKEELSSICHRFYEQAELAVRQSVLKLRHSEFKQSRECMSDITQQQQKVFSYRPTVEAMANRFNDSQSVFLNTSRIEGANQITNQISADYTSICECWKHLIEKCNKTEEWIKRIDKYEEDYPEYKRRLGVFKKETSTVGRKRILKEIEEEELTLEELPVIDIDDLMVDIQAEIEEKKTGWFKKQQLLKVRVKIMDNKEVPCRGVLIIQTKPLATINRSECYSEDFEKGLCGEFERKYTLPLGNCKDAKTLYIYFKPHEDEVISINSFVSKKNCKITL